MAERRGVVLLKRNLVGGGGGARVWRKIKLSVTAIFMYIGEVLMSTVRVCVFPALNIFTSTLEV